MAGPGLTQPGTLTDREQAEAMQHGDHGPLPQRMIILMGAPGAGVTADVLAGCLVLL